MERERQQSDSLADGAGGWGYVRPRMETASKGIDGTDAAIRPRYTGRGTAASTATGGRAFDPPSYCCC